MAEHLIRIEIEAETLEKARRVLKSQVGPGSFLVAEQIVAHGGKQAARASAPTTAAAFAQAHARVPAGAEIVSEQEVVAPGRRSVTVEALDGPRAAALVKSQLGSTESAGEPQLLRRGRKGLLGLGRRPGRYEVEIIQPSIVEITYKRQARLVAKVGRDIRTPAIKARLDEAERTDHPVDVICEKCGRGCKALPRPITGRAAGVMAPEIAMVASRFCEKCNLVMCGACVGVTLQSAPPDFGGRRCPRCGEPTEYAAVCHLRITDTILAGG